MSSTRQPISSPLASSSWLEDGGALFGIGLGDDLAAKPVESASQIGPYRLVEKLGEGGLGVVWRAQQVEPIQREVAIKFTKPGLHYRSEVITRFELERQALARMNHPNIAAILDAGTLPDERPYFVMELVHGLPLTKFCERRQLSVRERLQLFIVICQAVHHAHQKGILHRDLKPSNILVAEHNGKPVPKVIDFGIAKALDDTDPALNDLIFKTQLGDLPCATYQYMSPEQASRGRTDIDTRSDIYTLGVLLYELLTTKLPLPDDIARSNAFDVIAAHVCNIDPVRPSDRLEAIAAKAKTERPTSTRTRTSDLRGDLDWIVLRALEKDRERRYESAAALAEDLQRHLDHEPVFAGPPSALYRCRKWVRRHRVAFGMIAAFSVSLSIGMVSTLMALQRETAALVREKEQRTLAETNRAQAEANRALAEQREREAAAARDEEVRARRAADASRQIADIARGRAEQLINAMLYDLRDALEPLGRVPLLEQVSLSAQQYFDAVPASEDNDAQQRNRAAMLQNRGSVLLAKGDASAAMKLLLESEKLLQTRVTQQPNNVQRLHDLALAHERVGSAQEAMHDDAGAEKSYTAMLHIFEHLAKFGTNTAPAKDQATWPQDAAIAYERLGDLARGRKEFTKAITSYEQGVEVLKALPPENLVHRRLAMLAGKLAEAQVSAGPETQAIKSYELSLANLMTLPDTTRAQAATHLQLAALHFKKEAWEAAKQQAQETLKLLGDQDDAEAKAWRATALELAK